MRAQIYIGKLHIAQPAINSSPWLPKPCTAIIARGNVPQNLAASGITMKQGARGLALEKQLDELGFIDSVASLLRNYGRTKALSSGKRLHALLSRYGHDTNTFLINCIIEMYGNCGALEDAQSTFNTLPHPNLYTFNIMMKVYGRHGMSHHARAMFERIPNPDLYSWTTLINSYGQNGYVEDARRVFQSMPHRNVISWTAMIAAYAQNRHGQEALSLFYHMQIQGITANNVTFTCVLDACAIMVALEEGQKIHAAIHMQGCDTDIALGTSLVNMYGKCGSIHDARKCFADLPYRNVASWTAMISALAQHEHSREALQLLYEMQLDGTRPDKITFMSALDACVSMTAVVIGQVVHAAINDAGFDEDAFIENALVVMYGKCGRTDDAKRLFDRSFHQDVVSWTGMIGAFVQNGQGREALDLFVQMLFEGVWPDKIVLLCTIDACGSLQVLEKGKRIHTIIFNIGYGQDLEVGNALVNMYGKCGCLHHATTIFCKMPSRDIFSWNTIIAAFVHNGEEKEALDLFHQMQLEGIKPDKITFICILTACSHAGWIDEGRDFFVFMIKDQGIELALDHHVCMIDLLGRGGHLEEAEYLVCSMSSEKIALTWLCLLGACKVHGDVERGLQAAHRCMELDPENPAPYVLLSNICTTAGRWMNAVNVRDAWLPT